MIWKAETNYILIVINITVLSMFQYPPPSWTLPIFLIISEVKWSFSLKIKMQIVSVLSLFASFCVVPEVSDFFAACALGLAMNIGYQIDGPYSSFVINVCLAIGIIIAVLSNYVEKYGIARDMAILICTLPNLFMAQDSVEVRENANLWFLNPYYDHNWTYSLGFIIGGFLPLITISKHLKFFTISLLLLFSIFIDQYFYSKVLSFLRGLFIYDENKHRS